MCADVWPRTSQPPATGPSSGRSTGAACRALRVSVACKGAYSQLSTELGMGSGRAVSMHAEVMWKRSLPSISESHSP